MITAVIEGAGVSKFGAWVKIGGGYMNPSKFNKDGAFLSTFGALKKGDQVSYESDGKYIKSITVVGQGHAVEGNTNAAYGPVSSTPSNKDEQIARSTAIKAVLGSPLVNGLLHDKDISEAVSDSKALIEEMTRYILTGSFVAASV